MKNAMGVVILLALSAQITPAFAESAIEAAYALFDNGGDYKPMPPGGYSEKEPRECKNGATGCFYETTFKRIDDCRYIQRRYYEGDTKHPGQGVEFENTYDFRKARGLAFRKVPVVGGGSPVPGVAFDGEKGLICMRAYRGRLPDRRAIGGMVCNDKIERYQVEKRTASNARPNQRLFGDKSDTHILKLPNRAQFRSHWAALREYCPEPTGN